MEGRTERIKSVFIVRENIFQTYHISMPSKYQKTIVIISPLMKFGGQAVLVLLENTRPQIRIFLISVHLKDMEMLRSQLPYKERSRFSCCGCEINSSTAVRMTILYLARRLDRVDTVIHLLPTWDRNDDDNRRMRPLLCANAASVENFEMGLKGFFGTDIEYIELEHSLNDSPFEIAHKVLKIVNSS